MIHDDVLDVLKDYLSISDIYIKYPKKLSKWRILHMLRMREKNGLSKILIKIGNKFYIRKENLDSWLNENFGGDKKDV